MFPYLFTPFLSWRVDDYSDYAVASLGEAVSTSAMRFESAAAPPQNLQFPDASIRSAVIALLGYCLEMHKVTS
jgi:hypothetical protein